MVKKNGNTVKTGTTKTRTSRVKKTAEVVSEPLMATDIFSLINLKTNLKCKSATQKEFANLISEKEIIIAVGPAGTGKSYISVAKALELVKNPETKFNRIIISKPAVEAEEEHGFLPGDIRDKMDPFIASTIDIFDKIIGKANRIKMEELGYLEIKPLAYLRGVTIDNAVLLMEEAQNMSPNQMKTLLTRIGENSKYIISGDLDQSDRYKNYKQSGLYDAMRHKNVEEIGFIEFKNTPENIVRNKLISKILLNYPQEEIKEQEIVKKAWYQPKKEKKLNFLHKLALLIGFRR